MAGEIIVKVASRTPDATGKVPANASYIDKNLEKIEDAIQIVADGSFFEGLINFPNCSASVMVVSYDAFECVLEGGIYCTLASGSVTHDANDPTNPRIDIICVKPTVNVDGSGDITSVGEVLITKGTAAANPVVPDTPSGYLKIAEVNVAGGGSAVTLRNWKPMYAKQVMLKPTAQDTPGMTIKVNFFRGYIFSNTLLDKDPQNSPTFTAPAANKCAIDILHINSSGTLAITQGTEVDLPNEPSAPTYPSDELVICEVYLEAGDTAIYQFQIKDVRPWLWTGAGGEHDAIKIKGKTVDVPLTADDGKVLTYDDGNSKYTHKTRKGTLAVRIADISTAETLYLMLPQCTVTKIWSVLSGVIATADATITTSRDGTALTNGVITIAYSGSAAGDIDSCTPTANNDFDGSSQYLKLVGGGESDNTVPVLVTIEFEYKH